MRFLSTKRARVGLLAVCLALIGGVGCFSLPVDPVQRQQEMLAVEKTHSIEVGRDREAAARGDNHAAMRMVVEILRTGEDKPDVAQIMQLLEAATARGYGPAQYVLGSLLLTGQPTAGSNTTLASVALNPARGIELWKQIATRNCMYSRILVGPDDHRIAYEIAGQLRSGRYLAHDPDQADLWRARSIVHCGFPAYRFTSVPIRVKPDATPAERARILGWVFLQAGVAHTEAPHTNLTPDDIAGARHMAATLLAAVRDSERQYPAPPPY